MTRTDICLKKATSNPRCWGVGFIAMDIVDAEIGKFATSGGSCGNVMALLASLGWVSTPVSRLGQDAPGQFIRDEFTSLGLLTRHLSEEEKVDTPIVLQRFSTNKDGDRVHRFSLTCPECRGWLPRYRPITIKQADNLISEDAQPQAFYFDRVSPGALKLAKSARERGALVLFEPSSIGDEKKFQAAVDICHVLKFSDDRLGHVPDLPITRTPQIVVETQGVNGLRFRWRNRWTQLKSRTALKEVDAAGSGDWCSAALIHQIGLHGASGIENLRKEHLTNALELGQALAAINCGYFGARGAMQVAGISGLNQLLGKLLSKLDLPNSNESMDLPESALAPPEFCRTCIEMSDTLDSDKELSTC